jgi:hypothetical protein
MLKRMWKEHDAKMLHLYDSMIMMNIELDEHEHGMKSLTLNVRPRLKDTKAKQV